VRASLERIVGRTIEMRTRVDPGIIGGLVARVGDQLIDGSTASQLRNLRTALAG
jgi:F-type H+-transporting ATPase subunit delta